MLNLFPKVLFNLVIAGVAALVTVSTAAACSGISGGQSGYIQGGNASGDCGTSGNYAPSAPVTSAPTRSMPRPSSGSGFNAGAMGTAAGAAAIILDGLARQNGSSDQNGHAQSSYNGENCSQLQADTDAIDTTVHAQVFTTIQSAPGQKCAEAKTYYSMLIRKREIYDRWIFTCNGSYNQGTYGRVDQSNFNNVWNDYLIGEHKYVDKACNQVRDKRQECEQFVGSKSYEEARSCFKALLEVALSPGDQPAIDRANSVIGWVDTWERDQAINKDLALCEQDVSTRAFRDARSCFQGVLDASTDRLNPTAIERAHYIVGWVNDWERQQKLQAAVGICESAAAAKNYIAAAGCYQKLKGSDLAKASTKIQTRADQLLAFAKQNGTPDPAAATSPYDNVFNDQTTPDAFDGPGWHTYSSTQEDNVYGTSFYRDGTTKRPQ